MSIDFKLLVEQIIIEQFDINLPLKQYFTELLRFKPEYKLSIPEEINEEAFFFQLLDLAWRINYGSGYSSATDTEIARYRTFWPILDFLCEELFSSLNTKNNQDLKNLDVNLDLNTLLTKSGKPGINVNNILNLIQKLQTPQNYSIKNRRINAVKNSTNSLAGDKYKNSTPLNGVLEAIRVVKGYNENQVNDIMKFPRKYDLPATIKLTELMPIRRISQSLYLFYVNKLKNPLYTPIVQALIPELASLSVDQVNSAIDHSVGQSSPEVRSLQKDYEDFLNGKSKLLVKLVAESLTKEAISGTELAKRAAMMRQSSKTANISTTPSTTQNKQKTWKPTNQPIITTVKDFSQGMGTDQYVQDAYKDFYNSLTRGSVPTGWQTAGRVVKGILGGLQDLGSTLERI